MKFTRVLVITAMLVAFSFSVSRADDDRLGEKLGTVIFSVSGQPEAQEHVVRGVKLVHHMMYPEADHEFQRAAAADPSCALAYWGRAMTLLHPLWPDTPTEEERKEGAEQIRRGLACPPATAREKAYLETLNRYFGDAVTGDHASRLKNLDVAWSTLAEQYPDDLDATAFSALFHLAPVRFMTKDKSNRIQLEALARVQKVLAKIPDHPGAQHYKIHALDFPLLADRGLEVCDTYSSIAPDVPHALHMPTHIFTRRGLWDRSIEFNLRSAEAARKLTLTTGTLSSHYPHALDYLAYAYLQRGQFREADAVRQQVVSMKGPYAEVNRPTMAFAFAAVPARCALERQAWTEAAELPLHNPSAFAWDAQYINCDSVVHYARGIGAARSGRTDAARVEILALEKVLHELAGAKRAPYWTSQAETQLLAVRAWVELANKNTEEAIALMRRAAAIEGTADKESVTPGEVLPAGDLLGDMLLEMGKSAEALAAFEAVLNASPNRLNTLYGAGFAAEQAGDVAKARMYYAQLSKVAVASDAGLDRVDHARAFLSRKLMSRD